MTSGDFLRTTRVAIAAAAALSVGLTAACASTGSTVGSGVGDRHLQRPPYYAGQGVAAVGGGIGHLPIRYQRGGSHEEIFDPRGGAGTAVDALLDEMNAYLDARGVTTRLTTAAPRGTPPDVQFGCELEVSGDCEPRTEPVLGRKGQTMRLAVGRPSREWVDGASAAMADAGVDRLLVLTLEVGQYWTRQSGWRGDKSVELGTGHTVGLPWLTSLETPVTVLQLTGALVGRDGRAIRIGAEGLLAHHTRLLVSALGGQELITDTDVDRLRQERRDDLAGAPLVWQAAIDAMLAQLAGAPLPR